MLEKFMKKTKTAKAFLAVGAAVTMLLGTSLTALAAYDTVDNTTTPRVVAEADANVIATSDATQLYITGSITMVHDSLGSPDPVLVNNGDGSWVFIMYDGQTVALGVNNPYAAYTEYVPQITNTVPKDELTYFDENTSLWVRLNAASSENEGSIQAAMYGSGYDYGYSDIYNNVVITGDRVGSYVYNLSVDYYLGEESASYNGVPYSLSNTVTLAIYVLEAQAGAQTPTYTAKEQSDIDWNNSAEGIAAHERLKNALATGNFIFRM